MLLIKVVLKLFRCKSKSKVKIDSRTSNTLSKKKEITARDLAMMRAIQLVAQSVAPPEPSM